MSTNETLNSNEILNLRIKHTHDKTSNWSQVEGTFKPAEGEIIVYKDDKSGDIKAKIGDGDTLLGDLPFVIDRPMTDQEIKDIVDGIL